MEVSEHINSILVDLPKKPGVYQYFDDKGEIIYVGKAKSLRSRVRSYFNNDHKQYAKTRILVRKIRDIKYILVESEHEALLLENSLIKKHQPKYNIQLKDDKTYPWICIKKERFPRVFSTRRVVRDGSLYFGPYASVKMVNTLLDLIHSLYPLRNCNFNLSKQNIEAKKFKVCLEYHIGNCAGPCDGSEIEKDYNAKIDNIRDIIKGNIHRVIQYLKDQMKLHVEQLEFEKAQIIKEKIETLDQFQGKSTVVSPTIKNLDVLTIINSEKNAFVNYLKVVNGAIIQGHTLEIKKKLDESDEELLLLGLTEMRQRFGADAKEVVSSIDFETPFEDLKILVPQRGDKKKLLELSLRNAKFFGLEKKKSSTVNKFEERSTRVLEQLQKDLRLTQLPNHIECFDNSNFQGHFPVAACVVFKNGTPSKKDYRHFNIKTVEGPDDFASMEEVIFRRYKRMQDENQSLPQLIVIDGGKGQLGAAVKSLEKLGLRGEIGIIGIAKRLEEIYFPGDQYPLYLDKRSESLKIIQHLRNEAHRFGITHHRNKRSKAFTQTKLEDIQGVGFETAQALLRHYKSVKKISSAELKDLEQVVSKSKAKIVFEYFREKENME